MTFKLKTSGLSVAVLATIAVVAFASSCGGGASVSRSEVVIDLSERVIIPVYASSSEALTDLDASVRALCDRKDVASLDRARESWRGARAGWLSTLPASFGPSMDRKSRSFIDWWPVEPERIENTLATRDTITAEYVREFLSATQRGLGALETMLFAPDAEILKRITDEAIACEYLRSVSQVAAAEAAGTLAEWVGSLDIPDDGFAGFYSGTASSAMVSLAAVSETVRTSIFLIRSMSDMQLGAGLGANDGSPDITAIREGAAGNGAADIRSQLIGMETIYVGAPAKGEDKEMLGIGALVRGISKEADERVKERFKVAIDATYAVQGSLVAAISEENPEAAALYEALKELQRTLNTDVVSLLGISVGFADTDGDGG